MSTLIGRLTVVVFFFSAVSADLTGYFYKGHIL